VKNRTIARRYARGLFLLAREHDLAERIHQDLRAIVEALEQNPRLRVTLEHPQVPPARKRQLIEAVFGGRVSSYALNFLRLVVRKRREPYLALIAEEFGRIYDEARGVRHARLTSAVPLPGELVERTARELSRALGVDVRVHAEVDPDVIGGLVVQVGDLRIDASLRGRLRALRQRLAAGRTQMGVS